MPGLCWCGAILLSRDPVHDAAQATVLSDIQDGEVLIAAQKLRMRLAARPDSLALARSVDHAVAVEPLVCFA